MESDRKRKGEGERRQHARQWALRCVHAGRTDTLGRTSEAAVGVPVLVVAGVRPRGHLRIAVIVTGLCVRSICMWVGWGGVCSVVCVVDEPVCRQVRARGACGWVGTIKLTLTGRTDHTCAPWTREVGRQAWPSAHAVKTCGEGS